jgi:ferredoxin/flavodoxin---NADP+ reductase
MRILLIFLQDLSRHDVRMAIYTTERVLDVHHWSDRLFSFSTTRQSGLRFENGQFVMIGLELGEGRKIVRAYSLASANHEEHLEFYSIKVPNGPLTSRLQRIEPGDSLLVSAKPTGTLVLRDLNPGKRLFLLATGTGVAPFMSIVKDPEAYEHFEEIYLVRGAAWCNGLTYADTVLDTLRSDPYMGEMVRSQLVDFPCVTREAFRNQGRVTTLIESGELFERLDVPGLDPASDRFMICGNMRMIADATQLLGSAGLRVSPGVGVTGDFVVERAFVESLASNPQNAATEAA